MDQVRRFFSVLRTQLRLAVLLALQYRFDFFSNAIMSLFWTSTTLVPLLVLYDRRAEVASWSKYEAMLVVGFFTTLKGVLNGAIQPTLQNVVEHVRKGTLDFLLLKPVDSQLMVSTSRLELWRSADVLCGLGIVGYALHCLGLVPTLSDIASAAILLLIAVVLLYSIWIVVVSLAFHFVKVDNLSYLFMSMFDVARWPSAVFRGVFAFVFTFVLPLSVMTTYPALALLHRLDAGALVRSSLLAVGFFFLSRVVWLRSIRRYTSAGG